MESLKSSGIIDLDIEEGSKLKDIYENCDFLNYVIKEGFRFDPPAHGTLPYFAVEDVNICGVPISKGTIIRPAINFPHYNKNQWPNPTEFIPERFDPESEFYVKPNPKSFIPFSFGIRNCAGQTLAKLEARVVLSRILTIMDFQINQEILDNQYAKFNLSSQHSLLTKIKSVKA